MTLRNQIAAGFAVLLVPVVLIALVSIAVIQALGGAVDSVLLENERSLEAASEMDVALERIDSAALLLLLGREPEARAIAEAARPRFEAALQTAAGNVTIDGEQRVLDDLRGAYDEYTAAYEAIASASGDDARGAYAERFTPAFASARSRLESLTELNRGAAAASGAEAGEMARMALWVVGLGGARRACTRGVERSQALAPDRERAGVTPRARARGQ